MGNNIVENWSEIILPALKALSEKTLSVIPNIVGALIFLIIGWLVAKFIKFIVVKALKLTKFDKLKDKIVTSDKLKESKFDFIPSKVVGKFVYWTVLLLFFVLAADILGWESVSKEIGNVVRYIPKLLSGLLIFGIGVFIANVVKQALYAFTVSMGIKAGNILSKAAFYIILIFLTLAALNQIGMNTDIINSNITIIIGSLFFAFALSFGLASKEILQNIISGIYIKNKYKPGQKVIIGSVEGKIISYDNISLTLETDKGKVIIPLKDLANKEIRIIED